MRKLKNGITPGPYIEKVFLDWMRVYDSDHYAFKLPALQGLTELDIHPKVTFLIGENGSGKSTFLEALAVANGLNAEGGSRNMQFATRASHSKLSEIMNMRNFHSLIPDAWFLRAESLFNVATQIEILDDQEANARKLIDSYGGRSLHEQSHGESFMTLIENRFSQGLYFLDEPEAALSPQRQIQFLVLLHDIVSKDSQLVIATHSPIIMSYPDAWIYEFSELGIHRTEYEATEHYRVTKKFLEAPKRMLKHLLSDA